MTNNNTEVEAHLSIMQQFISKISVATNRVENLSDEVVNVNTRLKGPEPPATKEDEVVCGPGDISEVEYALSVLSTKLEGLEDQTRKLMRTLE
ncbi:MAG: hypothetical protein KAV87_10625 [Desulfobacteraceae bacterium]|nr:hypothetical protein [Desulfobacteraceae bacterium]